MMILSQKCRRGRVIYCIVLYNIYNIYIYIYILLPIGSMYGIYANIGGILMVNVATRKLLHGSYGLYCKIVRLFPQDVKEFVYLAMYAETLCSSGHWREMA